MAEALDYYQGKLFNLGYAILMKKEVRIELEERE